MQFHQKNVVKTLDGGQVCYDTTIPAREIAEMMAYGRLLVDYDHQRGRDTVTGKPKLDNARVERWTHDLIEGTAIFGQLTMNYRPESSEVTFVPDHDNPDHGTLIVEGPAFLPDSMHRCEAVKKAVESIAKGSTFDPTRRFSLRIWNSAAHFEDNIFYAMNQEHQAADATRAKYLSPHGIGQKLARQIMGACLLLDETNVETVSNTLSVKNHRLMAFNTLSAAFEKWWDDIDEADLDKAAAYFIVFWTKLVTVLPDLGKLSLAKRQKSRKDSIVAWAVPIHGYVALARRFYDENLDVRLLDRIADPAIYAWDNPELQAAGIITPAVNKKGETKLTMRNSHQTRRAMFDFLVAKCDLTAEPNTIEVVDFPRSEVIFEEARP